MKKFKAHTNEELIPHIEDGNEEALELLSLPVWENAIKKCDCTCVIGHVATGDIGELIIAGSESQSICHRCFRLITYTNETVCMINSVTKGRTRVISVFRHKIPSKMINACVFDIVRKCFHSGIHTPENTGQS